MPDVLADGVIRLGVDESFLQQSLDAAKQLIIRNVSDISKASSRLLLTNQGGGGTSLVPIGGGGLRSSSASSPSRAYGSGSAIALRSSSVVQAGGIPLGAGVTRLPMGSSRSTSIGFSGGGGMRGGGGNWQDANWRFNRGQLLLGSSSAISRSFDQSKWHSVTPGDPANVMGGLGRVAGAGLATLGGATALTFAGAAAAGSTTLDTLTGSLKMLSLAAGAKTQAPVMAISRLIQDLAKGVKDVPNGVIGAAGGAATGALIGAKMGGPWGALIGAGIGGVGAGLVEKGANDFADQRGMIGRLKSDPNKEIMKIINEVNDLEKPWWANIPFVGNNVEIAKRRGAIRKAENKGRAEDAGMLTAGLGGQASFSGADVREKAQMGIYGAGGALGVANTMEEMRLNMQAIKNGSFVPNWQPTVNPGNVAPPGWFN